MAKQRFVLDTSAFTGISDSKARIGQHIRRAVDMIAKSRGSDLSFYMPPSAWTELKGMLERKGFPARHINRLDARVIQKSPSRMELLIPSEYLYQYVVEVRDRYNRGLREAEKAVMKTKHGKETHEHVIHELRDNYRTALRQGLLDSEEDLDVLLLAKELKAGIVAKDAGIKKWARHWGIRFIDGESFPQLIKEYMR